MSKKLPIASRSRSIPSSLLREPTQRGSRFTRGAIFSNAKATASRLLLTAILGPVSALLLAPGSLAAQVPPAQQAPPRPCVDDGRSLCLLGDKVQVQVRFKNQRDPQPEERDAEAVPLSEKSGLFWFFNEDNYEILVKALDGRDVNGNYWLSFSSTTDIEFWLEVLYTETGDLRTYYNPPGQLLGVFDTASNPVPMNGRCEVNDMGSNCGSGLVCVRDPGTCRADPLGLPESYAGTCQAVPEPGDCDALDAEPVCGCNGQTYSNQCELLLAGQSELHSGECRSGVEGAFCGGLAGFPCNNDLFCELPADTCLVIADQAGYCTATGGGNCPTFVDPVCGCDGKTYSNDCFRQAAGVSRAKPGSCEAP